MVRKEAESEAWTDVLTAGIWGSNTCRQSSRDWWSWWHYHTLTSLLWVMSSVHRCRYCSCTPDGSNTPESEVGLQTSVNFKVCINKVMLYCTQNYWITLNSVICCLFCCLCATKALRFFADRKETNRFVFFSSCYNHLISVGVWKDENGGAVYSDR